MNKSVADEWNIARNKKGQKGHWNQATTTDYKVSLLFLDQLYVRNITVEVFDDDTDNSDIEKGLLGNNFLKKFDMVTFDISHGKMYLGK